MLDIDLIISFSFMALLFIRQIYILKQPNKINYAPLMLGIGAIFSVVHLIIHPEVQDVVLLLRESLFPFLISLILYIVINILNQDQRSETQKMQNEFTQVMISQINDLKEYIAELEGKIILSQQDEARANEDIKDRFAKDIKALDSINTNQNKFLEKFDELNSWQKNISDAFEDFKANQLPILDETVHKHIDILMVSENNHYDKMKVILEKAIKSRFDISEDIEKLTSCFENIKNNSDEISSTIINKTVEKLTDVSKAYQNQIVTLKTHAEAISTTLYEEENRLDKIKGQSELLLKQMILSTDRMKELESKKDGLYDAYAKIHELRDDLNSVRSEYIKSQAELSSIVKNFKDTEEEQIVAMRKQIYNLGEELSKTIEESLQKLHEHYHVADEEITQSVQVLAKKAQLKSYTQLDD